MTRPKSLIRHLVDELDDATLAELVLHALDHESQRGGGTFDATGAREEEAIHATA